MILSPKPRSLEDGVRRDVYVHTEVRQSLRRHILYLVSRWKLSTSNNLTTLKGLQDYSHSKM
jgi:hypothetical protein